MIKFCDSCNEYWNDRIKEKYFLTDWFYCTVEGHEIKRCPDCDQIIEDVIEDCEDRETGYEEKKDILDENYGNKI